MKTVKILSATLSTLVVVSSAAMIASCGGGGGSGIDTRFFGGIWSGAVTRTDSCAGISGTQTLTFRHTVNQNDEAIVLTDQNNAEYIGSVVDNSGFSVDASGQLTVGGTACPSSNRIEYHDIVDDDDTNSTVEFTFTANCPAANGCNVVYTGTASRAVASATPVPGATATPSGTAGPGTTPISGGCAAMNTNPAAGTFSGDGGCGISDAAFSINSQGASQVVVLEPFGGNGATSFVINPAAPASAASSRTDLTVNGSAGYSCTLACNPPGSFTATCFKEGGTQCTEKF